MNVLEVKALSLTRNADGSPCLDCLATAAMGYRASAEEAGHGVEGFEGSQLRPPMISASSSGTSSSADLPRPKSDPLLREPLCLLEV